MTDARDPEPQPSTSSATTEDGATTGATRRGALMLGALGVSAVVTIRPALANTAGSVLNCEIPVPDPAHSGQWIDPDGKLVPVNTPGAFRPALRPMRAEEVKMAMRGGTMPNADYAQSRAYLQYIRRLQQGTSGFTCFASLQMPRG